MGDREHQPQYSPSGFFVMRTPFLPWDEVERWGTSLEAPAASGPDLEGALARDRAALRAALRALVGRPAVEEALFLASPDLHAHLHAWLTAPDSEQGSRVERPLVRYLLRMAGRATPFGLFAGCAVGRTGPETRLTLAAQQQARRHTRLDMDYLWALTEALTRDPVVRATLVYRPNSSLAAVGGQLHYAEARPAGRRRSYHLVGLEPEPHLERTLERARQGATIAALAGALVGEIDDLDAADAEAYIHELIDSQVLVPDLQPPVTGPEAVHALIAVLNAHPATAGVAGCLGRVATALAALDAAGPGAPPEQYMAVARQLEPLPAPADLARLFQVDLVKLAAEATLSPKVLAEVQRGVALLHRLAPPTGAGASPLDRFRDAFQARYDGRPVPLAEALDEEFGIGFDVSSAPESESEPLLHTLAFPAAKRTQVNWGARELWLLRQITGGRREVEITEADLAVLAPDPALPLPDAFAVMATLAAPSAEALARGDFRVVLHGLSGPSGARLLGRFCHADPDLHRCVTEHLRAEEALAPDAIFAEVAHLPEGRIGNVLARPVLRGYEITFLGRSGAAPEQQIPISDLLVSVEQGRVVLRSRRLGCRVIPRLSTAHNYGRPNVGIYRFLCALQQEGVTGYAGWDWGPFRDAPFLPRVTSGRLVLCPARWNLDQAELRRLGREQGAARFATVQAWRRERQLPRWVLLADGDNQLPVDLENILCVEMFVDQVKARSAARLQEPQELCAFGPEGRYVHELVIPFVRRPVAPLTAAAPAAPVRAPDQAVRRSFPPGSEWLYLKLYCGKFTADQVLQQVRPVIATAVSQGAADRWFFIRYADPEHHLRLRVHGRPDALTASVLPMLQAAIAPFCNDESLWRVQHDTYEREVERYGGPSGIDLAEALFHADSAAVLTILPTLAGDAGADARWRLTLVGIDMLLADLQLAADARLVLMRRLRGARFGGVHADGPLRGQIGDLFRRERTRLAPLLTRDGWQESPLAPGISAFQLRSERLAPVVAELGALERAGQLTVPRTELAAALVHMHVNRMLRTAQNAQELVLYDLLSRLYEAAAARGGLGK